MIKLPKYTSKDAMIMIGMLTPVVVVLNFLLFGKRYIHELDVFLPATLVTFLLLAGSWQLHTLVAVVLRNRFPRDEQLYKRVFIAILLFMMMTGLNITLIFWGYDYVSFLDYRLDEDMYKYALLIGAIENVFVTFLHEGVSSYEKWKNTLKETELLKKEYLQGQLIGLKSQVNPHFLFNSLNSLSSLISENKEQAEAFLNEMSKVYRYMLRNNEEQLVDLQTELNFLNSYIHLLKARYRDGLRIIISIPSYQNYKLLPPLTFQMIFENILSDNRIGKDYPLLIEVSSKDEDSIQVRHSLQKKVKEQTGKEDAALTNISNKFRLLGYTPLLIEEADGMRTITLQLISLTENVEA